jgi:CBS domain-containing protein
VPRTRGGEPPSTTPPDGRAEDDDRAYGEAQGEALYLSKLLGARVLGTSGHMEGRLVDIIARLGGDSSPAWMPRVTGLVVSVEGEDKFAHAYQLSTLNHDGATLKVDLASLGPFERRPGEVLLGRDLCFRHFIYLPKARLVRANDIVLAKVGTSWQVVGIDVSSRPAVRRLLPRPLRVPVKRRKLVEWSEVEPFVSHVPTARLRIPFRRLRRLHPAAIADLVEAASHQEGEEIIEAVSADPALEADVFEELDTEHQLEFLRGRSDEEAAHLLEAMAPDDAVDLLTELDQERRLPILEKMSQPAQAKIRALLSYNPETAGGLMNPDFVSVPETASVAQALEAVRSSKSPPEASGVVFVTGEGGRLLGTALVVELLRAPAEATVADVMRPEPASLEPDADIHEVVRKMSDYNLTVAPVVDAEGRMLGQITVDDVLEMLLPSGWRRQYGMAAPE